MNRAPSHSPPTIALMGLRGSGKSTLGRSIARQLARPFVDLDDRTPALLGCATAAESIRERGLDAFRAAEREALEAVLVEARIEPIVLALGGGTPTAPGAGDLLRGAIEDAIIELVYLHAPPRALRERLTLTDTSERPSLTGKDMLDEIETVYLQRDALYRDLATVVTETQDVEQEQLADAIVALLGSDSED